MAEPVDPTIDAGVHHIIEEIIPEMRDRFIDKSRDYGDAYKFLGSKGQFSDINRKFWKLYNAVWMDQKLVGEPVPEILDDIIAHCLLLKLCLEEGI